MGCDRPRKEGVVMQQDPSIRRTGVLLEGLGMGESPGRSPSPLEMRWEESIEVQAESRGYHISRGGTCSRIAEPAWGRD